MTTPEDESPQPAPPTPQGEGAAPAPDPASPSAPAAGSPGGTPPAGEAPADGTPRPEARLERAVRAAEQALIEYEIAVETFRIEVENFSRLHHQRLGPVYARLDELDALIAEARAARTGSDEDRLTAARLRAEAMPMPAVEELFHGWMGAEGLWPEAAAMLTEQPVRPPERVRPSEEARALYRDLVRKAHPDLVQDEKERARRDEFISRVTTAYGRGDEAALRALATEWEAGPAPQPTFPSRSEELYARLEWLAQRKDMIAAAAHELEESAIGSMLRLAPDDPDRLIEEVAEQLLAQVAEKEHELLRWTSGETQPGGDTGTGTAPDAGTGTEQAGPATDPADPADAAGSTGSAGSGDDSAPGGGRVG
ncbi:hypothetical protein RM574_28445 [Streptomyces sp. DSM 41982]|uniref:J domain-containing protein n=1 Tax=Streptomyces evansiae TaxID=3075535 RepID=A0ABD5EFI2_9ACTN|nr:hypothetical protein [Streptomyces sp. DSM 41982]MDT0419413.1 hypothetical protein [Streptomyces sp. DSM 41982]